MLADLAYDKKMNTDFGEVLVVLQECAELADLEKKVS